MFWCEWVIQHGAKSNNACVLVMIPVLYRRGGLFFVLTKTYLTRNRRYRLFLDRKCRRRLIFPPINGPNRDLQTQGRERLRDLTESFFAFSLKINTPDYFTVLCLTKKLRTVTFIGRGYLSPQCGQKSMLKGQLFSFNATGNSKVYEKGQGSTDCCTPFKVPFKCGYQHHTFQAISFLSIPLQKFGTIFSKTIIISLFYVDQL